MELVDIGMHRLVKNKNKTKIIKKRILVIADDCCVLKPLGEQESTLNFV